MIEKLALALINSTKRLRPFFQSYQIKVNTNHPLKQVMRKPKFTGRMAPWSVKLFEFSLKCDPNVPSKGNAWLTSLSNLLPLKATLKVVGHCMLMELQTTKVVIPKLL